MSSILKALKKLEEQKAPRPKYEVDLSSGILRERKTTGKRRWIVPVAMVSVALAAVLSTYGVMSLKYAGKETGPSAPAAVTPPPLPGGQAATTNPPATPTDVPALYRRPASAPSAAPAAVRSPSTIPQPAKKERPAVAQRQPAATARTTVPASPPEPSTPAPQERLEAASQRPPNLRLSGIAWEKDSSSRYAVVNGMAVKQGATVEGAKIEEILPDKVRFSHGSRSFDLTLGTLAPPH